MPSAGSVRPRRKALYEVMEADESKNTDYPLRHFSERLHCHKEMRGLVTFL